LARTRLSTIPDPTVRVYAFTSTWLSARSIASTAKAVQFSSGEKQTATAAPDVTEATGNAGGSTPNASERAAKNTLYLIYRDG
jgi:hypothetical protein